MLRHIYDSRGVRLLRREDAEPECGKDFCEMCGDCLACYGDGPCIDGGGHFWVVYLEDGEEVTGDG